MIEHQILCKGKHQSIRLASINKSGIYLWCKSCHEKQLIPREEIVRKWEELDRIEEQNASISTRPVL
jgi:RNase P subunit RPR2